MTSIPGDAPSVPLSPSQRTSYEALLAVYQSQMDDSADPVVLTAINPSYLDVSDLLTKDRIYTLQATTAHFEDLKEQFDATNDGLKKLAAQIAATSAHFAEAAAILAAIQKAVPYVAAAL